MPEYPDEQTNRREDFKGGSPVVLANGQIWYFARPIVIFVPDDDSESGFVSAVDLEDDDGAFAELTAGRAKALENPDDPERNRKAFGFDVKMGVLLLKRNYNLTTKQVAQVMKFSFEDGTASGRIYDAVMAVARGEGPKPDGGGTD